MHKKATRKKTTSNKNKVLKFISFFFVLLVLAGCPSPTNPLPDFSVVPEAVSDLTVVVESSSIVHLSWTDNSDNETGFRIDWNTTNDFTVEDGFALVGENVTEYEVSGLNPSTPYYFRVIAINDVGTSTDVIVDAMTSDPPATSPTEPANLLAELTGTTEVTLTWDDVSTNEDGFKVQYSKTSDFSEAIQLRISPNTEEVVLPFLEENTTYFFKVASFNDIGDSDWTSEVNASTLLRMIGDFVINNDANGTNFIIVTLNCSIEHAEEMCYSINSGGFTSWIPYEDSKTINVGSISDGLITITTKFRNSVQDVVERTDSIILDREAPVINSFFINDENDWATSRLQVVLNSDVLGAVSMRVLDDHYLDWPTTWEEYNPSKVFTMSNFTGSRTVSIQYKDEFGNISETSDTIYYHPTDETISINGGYGLTANTSVSLTLSSSNAEQMQFRNENTTTWTSYETYATSKSWTLSSGDGTKTVFVRYKWGDGTETTKSTSITLDTTPPVITSLQINNGDSSTYDRNVYVTILATGADLMSFSTDGISWSPWQGYETLKSYSLFSAGSETANENTIIPVYVQVRDIAGNITTSSDSILFDQIAHVKFTLIDIYVTDDGDTVGSGEWKWSADVWTSYNSTYGNITNHSSPVGGVDDGDTITVNESKTLTFINGEGNDLFFRWDITEDDATHDDYVGCAYEKYSYPLPSIKNSYEWLKDNGARCYVTWKMEVLD